MSGRGGVERFPDGTKVFDEEGPDSDPRVLCFNAAGHWVEAREPMHADIDTTKVTGVGPGLIFAKELLALLRSPGQQIGLVPCAVGGTCMDQWLPGTALFQQMVDRALKAVGSFPSTAGAAVRLRGLLWYQGESDTDTIEAVNGFPAKLKEVLTTFWHQIGSPQDFIIQQEMESTQYLPQLRQAQLEVGTSMHTPQLWTVDAKGLELKADGMHLTREAQNRLGIGLAQQHIAIKSKQTSPAVVWSCMHGAQPGEHQRE